MKTIALLIVNFLPSIVTPLECYVCQLSYHTENQCSEIGTGGFSRQCLKPHSECFQVVESFQNDVLELVRRGCWWPSNGSRPGGFCGNYDNEFGEVLWCGSCKEDLCNDKKLYNPRPYKLN